MFENLTERLASTIKSLRGQGRLTEENIKDTLRDVRIALLEADVALPVVKQFVDRIRERAVGQEVLQSLTPGQALIKVVYDELVVILGEACDRVNVNAPSPVVFLLVGLQGSGKTTTLAKLAKWVKENLHKSVMVASADVYRPAAIEQLKTLAQEIEVEFYPSHSTQSPITIAQGAVDAAKRQMIDVLLIDTAGRLHIDEEMMTEVKQLHAALNPLETLFVVDSMTGQDAANTAQAFNAALPITGTILTKVDGDARGGAAMSIRFITNKPIKFIGVGEKVTALEPFYPDRIASRILGMGDILSLVEEAERNVDRKNAEKLAKKFKKGQGFDLEDFRDQLQQLTKMGGVANLLDKLPGMGMPASAMKQQVNDKMFIQIEAIINSMTPQERRFPDVIRGSRKRRIATGSGTQVQDINRLLKQFSQMQKMMKRFSKDRRFTKLLQGL